MTCEGSMDEGSADREPLRVTFIPELYLQRRIWVLDVLRREDVATVVDIGCGEGELLACLSQPAPWLRSQRARTPPSISLPKLGNTAASTASKCEKEIANIYCTQIHGLDISLADLTQAIDATAPPPPPCSKSAISPSMRWEPLEVNIWQGGLECINPTFVGIECIVSTEVIEHLLPPILPFYAPVLLGVYHPRLLLITTPSYTFNARWTPPGITERSGYPDPTRRTERVFRHHDHKFEWTIKEFEKYCQEAAGEWGYEVITSTVGRSVDKDPWGRDEECGGASQVAEFIRKEGEEWKSIRDIKAAQFMRENSGEGDHTHTLLAKHQHPAHHLSRRPTLECGLISEAVKQKMISFRESSVRFEELWFEQDISTLCGGWIELLLDAVDADGSLRLNKEKASADGQVSMSERREDWYVERVGADSNEEPLWGGKVERSPLVQEGCISDEEENNSAEGWGDSQEQEYDSTSPAWSMVSETRHGWGNDTGASGWGESTTWTQQDDGVETGTEKLENASWGSIKSGWFREIDIE